MDIEDLEITEDIDPVGEISKPLPADDVGWEKRAVWYGEQSMGDDALSLGYLAAYEFDMGDCGSQCLDVTYYVTASNNPDYPFDVMEMDHSYRRDADGEPMDGPDEDYSYTGATDFAYETYEKALWVARNSAMCDERFKLSHWNPSL